MVDQFSYTQQEKCMITENDIKAMDTEGVMWEYFNIAPEGKSAMTVADMVKEFSKVLDQKPDANLYKMLIMEECKE